MNEGGIGERVQALFREVNALAGQLRKPGTVTGAEDRLPAGERSILQVLGERGPQTVPGIARVRDNSRQSVQMLVYRLENQGWVELLSNPAHKRSALVCLTERGRDLVAKLTEREIATLEGRLGGISESGVGRACALLRQIRYLLAGKALAPGGVASRRGDRMGAMEVGPPSRGGGRRLPAAEQEAAAVGDSRAPGRRREAASAHAEDVTPPEASQPEAEEFPVNLL